MPRIDFPGGSTSIGWKLPAVKTFCALVLLLVSLGPAVAEFPAKLDGFAGITFGSSVEQAKAAMDTRGAVFNPEKSSGAHLEFSGGTFHNEPASYWHLYFLDGKLYRAM